MARKPAVNINQPDMPDAVRRRDQPEPDAPAHRAAP